MVFRVKTFLACHGHMGSMSYERLSAEMNEWAEREGATVETIHVFPRQDLSEVLLVVIYSPKVQPKDERVSAPDLEE